MVNDKVLDFILFICCFSACWQLMQKIPSITLICFYQISLPYLQVHLFFVRILGCVLFAFWTTCLYVNLPQLWLAIKSHMIQVFEFEICSGYFQERDNMQKTEFLKALSDMWKDFDPRVLRYKVWVFLFPLILFNLEQFLLLYVDRDQVPLLNYGKWGERTDEEKLLHTKSDVD